MAPVLAVVLVVEYVGLRLLFRSDLTGRPRRRHLGPPQPVPAFPLVVVGLMLVGFAAVSPFGGQPWWVSAAAAVVLAPGATATACSGCATSVRAAHPGFAIWVLSLGVVVAGLSAGFLGDAVARPGPRLAVARRDRADRGDRHRAGQPADQPLRDPAAGARCVAPLGTTAVLAALLGLNIGSGLTWTGSLANLLWRRTLDGVRRGARQRGVPPGLADPHAPGAARRRGHALADQLERHHRRTRGAVATRLRASRRSPSHRSKYSRHRAHPSPRRGAPVKNLEEPPRPAARPARADPPVRVRRQRQLHRPGRPAQRPERDHGPRRLLAEGRVHPDRQAVRGPERRVDGDLRLTALVRPGAAGGGRRPGDVLTTTDQTGHGQHPEGAARAEPTPSPPRARATYQIATLTQSKNTSLSNSFINFVTRPGRQAGARGGRLRPTLSRADRRGRRRPIACGHDREPGARARLAGPQPGPRARPGDRGRGAGRRPLGGPRRQGRRRRRGRRRDAQDDRDGPDAAASS